MEKIKLFEFITEGIKALGLDIEVPQDEVYFIYECPDGKIYGENVKFSPETGKEVKKVEYTSKARYSEDDTRDVIYALEEECPESFGFEYVTSVEKRMDDSDGYFNNMIFKRKSDGKFFYYSSYEGRIEDDELVETKKVVVESWDFEKYYM